MSKLKTFNGTSWETVNGQITGDTLPIGAIVPFGGWDAPTGWLICDGTLLSKTTYPELFNAIGYSFGGEDGGSTFGLPDLRGRVPLGLKETDTDFNGMGLTGGNKTHTQTVDEVAPHTHQLWVEDNSGSSFGINQNGGMYWDKAKNNWANGQFGVNRTNPNTAQPMNIMNPYQTVNYIIKAKQSAGVVAQVETSVSNSNTNVYSCKYVNDTLSNLIKIKEVAGTTDGNGFLNLNMNLNQYIVLGVRVKIGQDSFANPYNIRGIDGWSVQLKTWDGQNIGSTQFTLEVVYIET